MINDNDPNEPQDELPPEPASSKFPWLTPYLSKFQFTAKKSIIFAIVLIFLIGMGFYIKHDYNASQLRKQAASQVLAQAATMSDVQHFLGTVTTAQSITGTVDQQTQNARLNFTAEGSKGTGVFTAVLTNSRLSSLLLETADGAKHDVLADQADFNADQAAKAALAAQATAVVTNYTNAVTALRNKDYQSAIPGFLQAIQDKYQLAHSYNYLGFAYSQTSQYQQCITAYQQYVQLQADDSEAYYQIAYCYLQMYQTDAALTNLDKSCQLGYTTACQAAQQIRAQVAPKTQPNPQIQTVPDNALGGSGVSNVSGSAPTDQAAPSVMPANTDTSGSSVSNEMNSGSTPVPATDASQAMSAPTDMSGSSASTMDSSGNSTAQVAPTAPADSSAINSDSVNPGATNGSNAMMPQVNQTQPAPDNSAAAQ